MYKMGIIIRPTSFVNVYNTVLSTQETLNKRLLLLTSLLISSHSLEMCQEIERIRVIAD